MRLATLALGAVVFTAVLCLGDAGTYSSGLFSQAQAIIGRPLTPMSYAGVARRTSRRAAYASGAYGGYGYGGYGGYGYAAPVYAAPPPPVYSAPYASPYAPACTPLYDAYGRLVRPC
jgi:hypothetical protein